MSIVVCSRPECQSTAGCKCTNQHPSMYPPRRALWEYSDDEIAREYYNRSLRKLGDPRICVGGQGAGK